MALCDQLPCLHCVTLPTLCDLAYIMWPCLHCVTLPTLFDPAYVVWPCRCFVTLPTLCDPSYIVWPHPRLKPHSAIHIIAWLSFVWNLQKRRQSLLLQNLHRSLQSRQSLQGRVERERRNRNQSRNQWNRLDPRLHSPDLVNGSMSVSQLIWWDRMMVLWITLTQPTPCLGTTNWFR